MRKKTEKKPSNKLKVLFISAEAAPFIKAGGLADVSGALPSELNGQGVETIVVLPYYKAIGKGRKDINYIGKTVVEVGWKKLYCGIFKAKIGKLEYYFIDNEQYFWREKIYGEYDDAERFAFFSKAALELAEFLNFKADIIHANDWHAAMSIVYLDLKKRLNCSFYLNMKSLLAIHNIEFQGKFDPIILGGVFGISEEMLPVFMYGKNINLLKAGIQLADRVTTVSETYGEEILNPYFSFGLNEILMREKSKIFGITNGIDTEVFNPATDKALVQNYDISSINLKVKNKTALQEKYLLSVDKNIPLIAMVTRLTDQKGMDLVLEVMDQILSRNIQFVLLGTGYKKYEDAMREWESKRRDKVRSIIKFSTTIASELYAASDMFLMPSRQEPCGLSQMIAMRYGSIPIVHRIGGLKDTVEPYNMETKTGNGVTFESYNAYDMLDAIDRAISLYENKGHRENIIKNAMKKDFSWNEPARKYIELYKSMLTK